MSSTGNSHASSSLSLEELAALNDEIVSLVRAGVPLELGLKEVSLDQPGVLGRVCESLSVHMSAGKSLAEAVALEGNRFPQLYRTVVEAGLRVGRLTVPLEAIANFARELIDVRRKIGMALVYPLIVFSLSYALFVTLILEVSRRFHDTYRLFRIELHPAIGWLAIAGDHFWYWVWIPPLLVLLFCAWWWIGGRARSLDWSGPGRPFSWIPVVRKIAANVRTANFAELLALLIEHEVSLPEAVNLAANATVDARFRKEAETLARAAMRGEAIDQFVPRSRSIPPYLTWILARGEKPGPLPVALRTAAEMYRRKASEQAAWLKTLFPVASAVGISGGVTLLYALGLFVPLIDMLKSLTNDSGTL